eukprot:6196482-Pleurochrysis_carterae.AAC.1
MAGEREQAGPRLKTYSEDEFESLSEGAKRVARSRDMITVKYAECFLSQRTWRVKDWITVFARHGWLNAFWESKEMRELHMAWVSV